MRSLRILAKQYSEFSMFSTQFLHLILVLGPLLLQIAKAHGSFSGYMWGLVNYKLSIDADIKKCTFKDRCLRRRDVARQQKMERLDEARQQEMERREAEREEVRRLEREAYDRQIKELREIVTHSLPSRRPLPP